MAAFGTRAASAQTASEPTVAHPERLTLEIIATAPSHYPRALAVGRDGSVWAAFMAEQGVMVGGGLARVRPEPLLHIVGQTTPGWRSDQVNALLAAPDGGVLAATERGLHRVTAAGQVIPLGEAIPWQHLAAAADGGAWLAGTDREHHLFVGRLVGDRVTVFRPRGRCREVVRLFAPTPDRAVVVCSDQVWQIGPRGIVPLPLAGSPLFTPPSRSPERRQPPIWLYDAALTADGSLFLIGATRRLVRVPPGRPRYEVVATGSFSELCAGRHAQDLLVADFDGRLWRWNGQQLECVHEDRDRRALRRLTLDSHGSLWAEEDRGSAPHRLVRFDPPYSEGPHAVVPLDLRPGLLSPGILALGDDGCGGLFVSTNEGLGYVAAPPPEPRSRPVAEPAHAAAGGAIMPRFIIRAIPMVHCKRGPAVCARCRALAGPRLCLLDLDPPDRGQVERRVIGLEIDGQKVWREFDVVRTFVDEAEARAYAADHGITTIDLTPPDVDPP
ncbi:MAG: hypothetical protein OZSIB_3913 [Candidatus Ozemobacter sibiricus]|uniref:Uncharacterized protein n=1 Tax=Candidatus Ozemobacter sibiricus TaxID=2268124 RepID=A0A367ZPU1_9BACT|nr:MAG: hypothetical protein OZSIB_3913 [Candidatus Ozemobacter sibiricus]